MDKRHDWQGKREETGKGMKNGNASENDNRSNTTNHNILRKTTISLTNLLIDKRIETIVLIAKAEQQICSKFQNKHYRFLINHIERFCLQLSINLITI